MPESSYYTGKSELLQWVNDILELQLVGLEELSNGAVYCQLIDAYFSETVNMHRVMPSIGVRPYRDWCLWPRSTFKREKITKFSPTIRSSRLASLP